MAEQYSLGLVQLLTEHLGLGPIDHVGFSLWLCIGRAPTMVFAMCYVSGRLHVLTRSLTLGESSVTVCHGSTCDMLNNSFPEC